MPRTEPIESLNRALGDRYVIERELGEGGMAKVYLARDVRHGRQVALKVLKGEVALTVGAERFLREIQTAANLQHPQILPLFDSGQVDGHLYYVMPYVDGETLRDRMEREGQLPVDEAVTIAVEVAEALQVAHEHGVVHRDIKPANILLSRGRPILADFGIAFAVAEAGARRTETGLAIGTPAYMSPEQVSSERPPTPASDIYSTACVLYEMLVGEPPFTGSTAQVIVARALTEDTPSAMRTRASVPPNVESAIRKGLEKIPADRFNSAEEFARALRDPTFRHGGSTEPSVMERRWRQVAGGAVAVAAVSLIGLATTLLRPDPSPAVSRFAGPFEPGQAPTREFHFLPDGSGVAYVGAAPTGALDQIWVRRWRQLEAVAIAGSEGAITLVVSPDGASVSATYGFPGPIVVMPVEGGARRTVVDEAWVVNYWSEDGYIYFQRSNGGGISRIHAAGGPEEEITRLQEGEQIHGEILILPGGRLGVFRVWHQVGGEGAELWLLDLESKERHLLLEGRAAEFLPATGHLVFGTEEGFLMAVSMDPGTGELLGEPFPVTPGVALEPNFGGMYYDVSSTGDLLYRSGGGPRGSEELVWASRSGAVEPVESGWTFYPSTNNSGWAISPDGFRIAFTERRAGNNDVWIKDLRDSTLVRLTSYAGHDVSPAWTPDGRYVTFSRDTAVAVSDEEFYQADFDVWRKRADGTGVAERLVDADRSVLQSSWGPDGRWLLLRTAEGASAAEAGYARDIVAVRPDLGEELEPLVESTGFSEYGPVVSPDGRWLAYSSDETGTDEVYVRPFPEVGQGRVQVSRGGGIRPLWSKQGPELFYVNAERMMVAARYAGGAEFSVLDRTSLFELPAETPVGADLGFYDVTPDASRFLMSRRVSEERGNARHVLIQGWVALLRSQESR